MCQNTAFLSQSVPSVTGCVHVSCHHLTDRFAPCGNAHNAHELVFADCGEVLVQSEAWDFLLRCGEAAFFCPDAVYRLHPCGGGSANVTVISFFCEDAAAKQLEQRIFPLSRQEKQLLTLMRRESSPFTVDASPTPDLPAESRRMLKNLLECFLILLSRRKEHIHFLNRSPFSNRAYRHAQIAERLMEHMHRHYAEKITLESLAAAENISISLLKQIFKEQTGDTAISYLTKCRIDEAKRLIQESNLNFSQIALAVGYDGISYFSSLFKKHTGMTPSEFAISLRRS